MVFRFSSNAILIKVFLDAVDKVSIIFNSILFRCQRRAFCLQKMIKRVKDLGLRQGQSGGDIRYDMVNML